MVVAGEAADGMETLAFVRTGECDVVLLDISMPGKNGIDTLRQIKRSRPDLPVLILSAYSEQQYAVSLLRAGASGYISKESASEQLVSAIRTVIKGGKYVSPSVAQVLVSDLSGEGDKPLHAALSKREFQIFYRLAAGRRASRRSPRSCFSASRRSAPIARGFSRRCRLTQQRRSHLLRDQERTDRMSRQQRSRPARRTNADSAGTGLMIG